MSNPLLEDFNTPFQTVPFGKIKNEHYLPALDIAMILHKSEIEEIKKNSEEASFENTIVELEFSGAKIDIVASVFFNLHSAETNDEMAEIAKEFSPKLTEHSNDINLDEKLFSRVKFVYDKKNDLSLSVEQDSLLEKTYKGFVRNGALLNETAKNTMREIDGELSKLGVKYSDNVLKETNDYKLVVQTKEELEGLPEGAIEAAAMTAKEMGHKGKWAFTLDYPSYIPLTTYAKSRELRKEIATAMSIRAAKGNDRDNKEIVKRIAVLRFNRANLLGYSSHADFTLEQRMALKAKNVFNLLNEVKEKALPSAKEHMKEVKDYAVKLDNIDEMYAWDYAYYFEKLKKEKYSIDDEMLKPYFKLENVIDGVFMVAKNLYGLCFEVRTDIPKYHEDVITYEVKDRDGNHLAVFYGDYFPRKGKRGGAWMTEFREQFVVDGKDTRPHVVNVCNFTKPTDTKPSLLTFNEVTTLFHEFGHGLHGILSKCNYQSLSGPNVYWDFVELPSQILENWAYEKECLDLFAKHYETGELIPEELVTKLKASANFGEGRASLRQVSLGLLDMSWHAGNPSRIIDIEAHEDEIGNDLRLLPKIDGAMTSTAFSHIFAGGYSAGYYSYKWAEVLDADAFELFKEKGIFNTEVADKFRENILEKGGTEHPMELYKRFRGHEPSPDALLRRSGLIK